MLEVLQVSLRRGGRGILRDVNLRLERGETRILAGASGAGKTTLLRIIAGLEAPDSGVVSLEGRALSEAGRILVPAHQRGVSMSFQDGALWPHLSAERHLRFGLDRRLPHRDERDALVEELLEFAGLTARRHERPGRLSGGERQRLGLARALAQQAPILLLDEPLAHVDLRAQRKLAGRLAVRLQSQGVTALWVTHHVQELSFLEATVSLLEEGTLRPPQPVGAFLEASAAGEPARDA